MSRARPFAVHRFAWLTVRTPSFTPFPVTVTIPFTCSISVAQDLSGSSVRLFPLRAERFVAPRCPRIDDRRAVRPVGRAAAAWVGSSGLDPPALRVAPPIPDQAPSATGAAWLLALAAWAR